MIGWSANFMEREEKHHNHKAFAVLDAPAIILTLTSGRTGTHYLASLFSVLPNVYSVHEPEPTLSSRKLAQGELSTKEAAKLIINKSDSILATLNNSNSSTYVETSHALLFHTPLPSPLIERLLEKLDGRSVGVIILKRDPSEVMMSRFHLGHMTCYFESSVIRYRGVGWIYTPESRNAHIPIIKPDNQLTQLELLAGYVLNVEAVKENFVKKYKGHPRVKIYEIELTDLSKSLTRIAHMMNYFKLVYNRDDLIKVMEEGKTNERKEDKEKARIRDKRTITLDDCRLALNDYRKRVAIESRKMNIT